MIDQDTLVPRLQEENLRLKRAVEELSILNDLARAIGASSDSNEIMGIIVRRSLRAVGAEQGVITLVDSNEAIDPMKTLVRAALSTEREKFHLHQAILGWMHLNKMPLLMNTPGLDDRFKGVKWDPSVKSLLCVPLVSKSELKGVLTLYNKKDGKNFTEEDQRLLAIIAAQSAQVIENARLNEQEKQLLKMQEQVRLAARIQSELLPREPPAIPGYDIAGLTIPAQEVGGDYFDFIKIADSRWAVCLGDVTGKGLPASLLMANTQATLRSQSQFGISVKESIYRANVQLFKSTDLDKFVTLFYGVLDTGQHSLTYCNAGHEPPVLYSSNGTTSELHTGGVALAMVDEFAFEEDVVALNAGDVLVIVSDGITEAMNGLREQYGTARLEEVIRLHNAESSSAIVDAIVKAVRAHAGSAPQTDDITLVVVKRQH